MMLAKVERSRAEGVRKRLAKRRLVRKDLRIREEGDHVLIPLVDAFDPDLRVEMDFEIVDGELASRTCYRPPVDLVRERADIPERLKALIPKKWEMIGDVILLRLPSDLRPYAESIAEAYASVLNARTVCEDLTRITGVFRTPEVRILFGSGTETVHYENGMYYKLDVAKIMFSSGNIDEKLRMASLSCSGETVVDMFAGIGYFTLPIAVHAKASKVIACEINPVAYHYLKENIALNDAEEIIEPVLGDNRSLPGEGIADRILMGYVRTTHEHLQRAFSLIREGGTIHYHDTFPLEVYPAMAMQHIGRASQGKRFEVTYSREVKSYSPGVSHMVLDIKVLD